LKRSLKKKEEKENDGATGFLSLSRKERSSRREKRERGRRADQTCGSPDQLHREGKGGTTQRGIAWITKRKVDRGGVSSASIVREGDLKVSEV